MPPHSTVTIQLHESYNWLILKFRVFERSLNTKHTECVQNVFCASLTESNAYRKIRHPTYRPISLRLSSKFVKIWKETIHTSTLNPISVTSAILRPSTITNQCKRLHSVYEINISMIVLQNMILPISRIAQGWHSSSFFCSRWWFR